MESPTIIKTERLILRNWRQEDFKPFGALNRDPLVREYFPSVLTQEESDKSAQIFLEEIEKNGYGFFAVSAPGFSEFIGFCGIRPVGFEAHFTPAVEIGWRLSREHWGKGYATEAALAVLKFGFQTFKLNEIVSFTAVENTRSRNVMEKIGMHRAVEDDFDHPFVPLGHKVRRQVLYRIHP